jgi:hypothetical protein
LIFKWLSSSPTRFREARLSEAIFWAWAQKILPSGAALFSFVIRSSSFKESILLGEIFSSKHSQKLVLIRAC